jgi:hypothetical protein
VLIRLELDRLSGLYLHWALERLEERLDRDRLETPPELDQLRRDAWIAKYGGGQNRTPGGGEGDTGTDEHDEPAFLTRRAFAARCGRSERTVRRWIAAGKVRASVAGIPRSELDRLRGARRAA